jgi:hypothetical protein
MAPPKRVFGIDMAVRIKWKGKAMLRFKLKLTRLKFVSYATDGCILGG